MLAPGHLPEAFLEGRRGLSCVLSPWPARRWRRPGRWVGPLGVCARVWGALSCLLFNSRKTGESQLGWQELAQRLLSSGAPPSAPFQAGIYNLGIGEVTAVATSAD